MAIQAIYYGERENMVAEVSAFDVVVECGFSPATAKYLIMPVGDEQYDTEYCSSLKDAKAIAREWAREGGVKVCRV